MKTILIAFALAMASAQTAKVIALEPDDAKELKSLHEQKTKIDTRLIALERHILAKYTPSGSICSSLGCTAPSSPWDGFEASQDYKYIVPKVAAQPRHLNSTEMSFSTGTTLTPACGYYPQGCK